MVPSPSGSQSDVGHCRKPPRLPELPVIASLSGIAVSSRLDQADNCLILCLEFSQMRDDRIHNAVLRSQRCDLRTQCIVVGTQISYLTF